MNKSEQTILRFIYNYQQDQARAYQQIEFWRKKLEEHRAGVKAPKPDFSRYPEHLR